MGPARLDLTLSLDFPRARRPMDLAIASQAWCGSAPSRQTPEGPSGMVPSWRWWAGAGRQVSSWRSPLAIKARGCRLESAMEPSLAPASDKSVTLPHQHLLSIVLLVLW